MMIGEAKERRDGLRAKCLDLQRQLTANRRAFVIDKTGDLATKVTLEDDLAQVRYDLNMLDQWIHQQKVAEDELKRASLLDTLIRLLQENDLAELVREARRRATDATHTAMKLFTEAPAVEQAT